ncbi:hypothetical protein [Tabrizicola sp.]|uniref:hypothetical protein n=1 Tax=Tabrizicola sp. TaxID=2005166 RepID=UPI003D29C265
MPKLIALYIRSVAIGFGLSAAFLALILWQDVAGLRHLIFGSDMGLVAAAMVFVFQGIVFASVQFGIAVMSLADKDEPPRGGLRDLIAPQIDSRIPVRFEVTKTPQDQLRKR